LGPYPGGRFYAKPHQCVAIPADLRLCHSVGYDKMVLPNLLDHETMAEVKHQASSWQFFGFFWPEMLKCDQFPQDDVCIAMTAPNATEVSRPK
ncbi:PREDICTED: secreted frizzled-related protein 1-like, partial [Pterocles gutturalis]|uniref:secreted frizzled-related protein 1-like n=1 Tax=Pterocles gutturalis TaxID=240206 RepID=UPI00052809AC